MAQDDPARRMPVELLLRDYFEPRLLPIIFNGEPLGPVPRVDGLNPALPVVEISQVRRVGTDDRLEVTVVVSQGVAKVMRDGKSVVLASAAYDLRLFREGQLVDLWPAAIDRANGENARGVVGDRAWLESHHVGGGPLDAKVSKTFTVSLPHRKEVSRIELSAYAFNEDRVKSVTARHVYQLPAERAAVQRPAYLITMGGNAFEDPSWDLNFAASDARLVLESMGNRLRELRQFEVVPICLISDRKPLHSGEAPATRDNLRAVLGALSKSAKPNAGLGASIPGADRLRPATPDDLVFVFTSTHGYTSPGSGTYYLFPHDIGRPAQVAGPLGVSQELLARCVRYEDLSDWLRAIDAGRMALVVDACHAAATVEQPGFKPGPMGSRGLGQLAYDKGMYVLAASAADDVALEFDTLSHGLLTYA